MSKHVSSRLTQTQQDWSPGEIIEQVQEKKHRLAGWYRLTAPPELPANANFLKREAARRGHLLSTVVLFLMLTLIMLLPATFFIPNRLVIIAVLIVLGICGLALLLNRIGKTLLAGIIIVVSFELALITIVVTTIPFDVFNLPLFDMFIMAELLAISLLPARNVFIVALFNILFTLADLRFQPHTHLFTEILRTQFYNSLARPASLEILVAVVAYLWSRNTTQAIMRADRAEMVASLEHALAEQKHELELGIQQIMQTHISVANGDLNARTPLTQENVLWHVANSLNTLLARFQRASLAQQDLERVGNAVTSTTEAVQEVSQRLSLQPLPPTKTVIDPLLISFNALMFSLNQQLVSQQQRQNVKPDSGTPPYANKF